jgi:hypothetical protein
MVHGELDKIMEVVNMEDDSQAVYKKLELFSSVDDQGKCWEIRKSTEESLRESDLVELANWIARELGWIKK